MGKYGKPHLHLPYMESQSPVAALSTVLIGVTTSSLCKGSGYKRSSQAEFLLLRIYSQGGLSTSSWSGQWILSNKKILGQLQPLYQKSYGRTFTQSLAQHPGSNLQEKQSHVDKKRFKRSIQRECKNHIEAQINNMMHSVLAENIPLNKYKHPRLSVIWKSWG